MAGFKTPENRKAFFAKKRKLDDALQEIKANPVNLNSKDEARYAYVLSYTKDQKGLPEGRARQVRRAHPNWSEERQKEEFKRLRREEFSLSKEAFKNYGGNPQKNLSDELLEKQWRNSF